VLKVFVYKFDGSDSEIVPEGLEFVRNPVPYFSKVIISADATDKALVETIDEGVLVDSTKFLDRFGVMLYTRQLSTGCKVALLVNNTDAVIDLRECGPNAVSAILSLCKSGSVALPCPGIDLTDYTRGETVDIVIDNKHFHSIHEVSAHFQGGALC